MIFTPRSGVSLLRARAPNILATEALALSTVSGYSRSRMVWECMNRTDILSEIKEAERRADETVANAEAERKSAVAQARRDSVAKVEKARADMSEAYDKTVAAEKAKFDQENAEILAAGKAEADAIEQNAEEKIKEVSDFLTKAFERAIDVSS